MTCLSATISIYAFTILVWICKFWKKEVYFGSNPVEPAGMDTSSGAIMPGLAGDGLISSSNICLISPRSPFEKMRLMLPLS